MSRSLFAFPIVVAFAAGVAAGEPPTPASDSDVVKELKKIATLIEGLDTKMAAIQNAMQSLQPQVPPTKWECSVVKHEAPNPTSEPLASKIAQFAQGAVDVVVVDPKGGGTGELIVCKRF